MHKEMRRMRRTRIGKLLFLMGNLAVSIINKNVCTLGVPCIYPQRNSSAWAREIDMEFQS